MRPPSAATLVREQAGLTKAQAAGKLRICPAYLSRIESGYAPPYALATRMARLYKCTVSTFLELEGR